ncbi:hypothetical protein [Sphingomonas sp.]|jgi:hypothetical protein|uniref:hypothetical protein n=1 Tax=Sphingomonas sp. TaxID=28214 RepID=UPI0035694B53
MKHLNAACGSSSAIFSSHPFRRPTLPSTNAAIASRAFCVDLLGRPFRDPPGGIVPLGAGIGSKRLFAVYQHFLPGIFGTFMPPFLPFFDPFMVARSIVRNYRGPTVTEKPADG